MVLRVIGPLDLAALQHSLDEIVRRHEPLRTTFRAVAEAPLQVIHPAAALPIEAEDLTGRGLQAEAEALSRAAEEAKRPFDLFAGPLFRIRLFHVGEADHLLVLTMHHIVSDGWSLSVLADELGRLYTGFATGHPARLPDLPLRFA